MYSVQSLESKFYYPEGIKCQDHRYLKMYAKEPELEAI